MLRALNAAFVLSAALPAEGQFMRSMMSLRGSSGSFMSSSTWFRGNDGQMHNEVTEQRSDSSTDEYSTKHIEEKVVCKDGHCHKETMTMSHPVMPGVMHSPDSPCPMHQRARVMMGRIASMMGMRPPMPPTMVEFPMGPSQVGGAPMPPPTIVEMRGQAATTPHMVVVSAPSLRGLLRRIRGGAPDAHASSMIQAAPTPQYKQEAHDLVGTMIAAPMLAGSCMALAGLLAALKFCHHGPTAASAREPKLRSLREPLAPIPEGIEPESPTMHMQATVPAIVVPKPGDGASTAAKTFLQGVYSNAQANIESKAVKGYLSGVYARAASA
mmetsp:Transcript_106279/g.307621  ORF Transcript_106279/g.307621 Transcript_106279/m.307621 type:complete len:326 (-) Transcript_106279:97-1074(-)